VSVLLRQGYSSGGRSRITRTVTPQTTRNPRTMRSGGECDGVRERAGRSRDRREEYHPRNLQFWMKSFLLAPQWEAGIGRRGPRHASGMAVVQLAMVVEAGSDDAPHAGRFRRREAH